MYAPADHRATELIGIIFRIKEFSLVNNRNLAIKEKGEDQYSETVVMLEYEAKKLNAL